MATDFNYLFYWKSFTVTQIKDMTLIGFFKPIQIRQIFVDLNWDLMWNFVFKKTIPFFWIPAHTITFLLPTDFQVLFAAALGIALGTILAVAELFNEKNT